MCGLCGYYTGVKHEPGQAHTTILSGLLVSNMGRGTDSTGVALIHDKSVKLIKRAESADLFVKHIKIADKIAIGHTRWATTGAITPENSHPFVKGAITGAHNGIVSNYLKIDDTVEVDSEVIFSLIDEVGYVEAFKRLSGSFAIVWHDKKHPSAISFVRSGNPLSLAKVAGIGYVWSSEIHDLLSHLVGYKYSMVELKENIVYTLDGDKITKTKVSFEPIAYKQYYTSVAPRGGKSYQDFDDLEYYRGQVADEPLEPRCIYDQEYTEGGHSIVDRVYDLATCEGCSVCDAICDKECYTDQGGYIFCSDCHDYAEGIVTKYTF